ncbi:hypothetical protein ACXPWS_26925 [Mycobacterium sp. BMJ-28]
MSRNRALIGAAIVLVLALIAGIGVAIWKFTGADSASPPQTSAMGTPADLLAEIPTSKPEPSWTVKLGDLIQVPDLRQGIIPGYVDNRAFSFVYPADEKAGRTHAWVYSFDYHNGDVLFPPVEMVGSPDECYINGPDLLVCLGRQDASSTDAQPTAWVIDSHTGALTYSGATDIHNDTVGDMKVYSVGNYPVASVFGTGWYGIGAHGERTWFVPGNGLSTADIPWSEDVPPQRLVAAEDKDGQFQVFSASDGRVLAEKLPGRPWLYSGGYAVPSRSKADPAGTVTFFDESGNQLSQLKMDAKQLVKSMATRGELLVLDFREPDAPEGRWQVFDKSGTKISEFPAPADPDKQRVIVAGDKMYVSQIVGTENTDKDNPWKQIDLSTGSFLRTCNDLNMRGYVASDGKTILSARFEPNREITESAVSADTCQTLWSITGRDDGIVKIGNALVQSSDAQYNGLRS